MKCKTDNFTKDCCNQEDCCEDCKVGYENCTESCCEFDKIGSCEKCKFCQYDIGTKIKIRKDLVVDNFYDGLRFHNGMAKYKGETSIIVGIPHYSNIAYAIEIDPEGYDWSKEMFESV